MKHLIGLMLSVFLAGPVLAQRTMTVIIPGSPGSGDHRAIMALAPVAERSGVKFDIHFPKTCRTIMQDIRRPNTLAVTPSDKYAPGNDNAECGYPADSLQKLTFLGVMESTLYWCAAPGKQFTEQDIRSGREIRVGSGSGTMPYLNHLVASLEGPHNVRTVLYKNLPEVARASIAGDIDMWIPAAMIRQQPDAKCLGASSRKNLLNVPFVGRLTKQKEQFEELTDVVALTWIQGNVSSADEAMIRGWLASPEFNTYRVANKLQPVDGSSAEVERSLRRWNQSSWALKK